MDFSLRHWLSSCKATSALCFGQRNLGVSDSFYLIVLGLLSRLHLLESLGKPCLPPECAPFAQCSRGEAGLTAREASQGLAAISLTLTVATCASPVS